LLVSCLIAREVKDVSLALEYIVRFEDGSRAVAVSPSFCRFVVSQIAVPERVLSCLDRSMVVRFPLVMVGTARIASGRSSERGVLGPSSKQFIFIAGRERRVNGSAGIRRLSLKFPVSFGSTSSTSRGWHLAKRRPPDRPARGGLRASSRWRRRCVFGRVPIPPIADCPDTPASFSHRRNDRTCRHDRDRDVP